MVVNSLNSFPNLYSSNFWRTNFNGQRAYCERCIEPICMHSEPLEVHHTVVPQKQLWPLSCFTTGILDGRVVYQCDICSTYRRYRYITYIGGLSVLAFAVASYKRDPLVIFHGLRSTVHVMTAGLGRLFFVGTKCIQYLLLLWVLLATFAWRCA